MSEGRAHAQFDTRYYVRAALLSTKKNDQDRDIKIKKISLMLTEGEITITQFLELMVTEEECRNCFLYFPL